MRDLICADFIRSYCIGVVFHRDSAKEVIHKEGMSVLRCADGTEIAANLVLDATGHAKKLVEFDRPFNPGFQVISGLPGSANPFRRLPCCPLSDRTWQGFMPYEHLRSPCKGFPGAQNARLSIVLPFQFWERLAETTMMHFRALNHSYNQT